jgi:hypothetical protein
MSRKGFDELRKAINLIDEEPDPVNHHGRADFLEWLLFKVLYPIQEKLRLPIQPLTGIIHEHYMHIKRLSNMDNLNAKINHENQKISRYMK